MTRSMGYYKDTLGIRTNVVCPAISPTGLLKEALKSPQARIDFAKSIGAPLDFKFVEVESVIDAFMWAIEDEKLAGQIIRVTGEKGPEHIGIRVGKIQNSKL